MWGTDEEWMKVGMNLCLTSDEKTVRTNVVTYLDKTPDDRAYGKKLMMYYGVWEQAQQIARELDLKIEPNV